MTAATITPAALAAEAHAVLHVLMETAWPRHEDIKSAATRLERALDDYRALTGGVIGWEAVHPELSAVAAALAAEALEKAAREADDAAEALITAIARHRAADGTEGDAR